MIGKLGYSLECPAVVYIGSGNMGLLQKLSENTVVYPNLQKRPNKHELGLETKILLILSLIRIIFHN